jgi:hypothetical protein
MPENVRLFEYYSYGTLALGILAAIVIGAVTYARLPYEVTADPAFAGILGVTLLITLLFVMPIIAIYILLVWLTARRRSAVARFILAAFYIMGLLFMMVSIMVTGTEGLAQSIPGIVITIGQGIALFLVFSGDARPWFALR